MPMPRHLAKILTVISLFTGLLLASVASAQVSADNLGLAVQGGAQFSKAKPQLVFHPDVGFSALHLACDRSDGQKVGIAVGALKANAEKRVVIAQGKGVFTYKCMVSGQSGKVKFADWQMEFETKVGEPPKVEVRPADVDEVNHKITLRMSEVAARVELDIIGDDGRPIDQVSKEFHGDIPGTPLTVSWKQDANQVMARFSLRAYEPAGYFNGIESVTFVDIPHEDVVFESGKWDIRPSEEGKLLAPYADIVNNIKKVQGVLQISLYIGGYTDTVGQAGDNLELSRKRAHSIAEWFAKKGISASILAQGFGETVLKVPTPDSTDEVRNRRASYVLATQPPPASRGFPARNWAHVK